MNQNMWCRSVLICFSAAYLIALFLFFTGKFGWFGQDTDPLSGIFLLPLGLPWNLIKLSDGWMPWLGALSPAINLAVLWLLCRRISKTN